MAWTQLSLTRPLAVRTIIEPCLCGRECGGLRLAVRPTEDRSCYPASLEQVYEHLAAAEALDVIDSWVWELSGG